MDPTLACAAYGLGGGRMRAENCSPSFEAMLPAAAPASCGGSAPLVMVFAAPAGPWAGGGWNVNGGKRLLWPEGLSGMPPACPASRFASPCMCCARMGPCCCCCGCCAWVVSPECWLLLRLPSRRA